MNENKKIELQVKIKTVLGNYKKSRGVNTQKAENDISNLINSEKKQYLQNQLKKAYNLAPVALDGASEDFIKGVEWYNKILLKANEKRKLKTLDQPTPKK